MESLFEERCDGAQFVAVQEVSQFVAVVVSVAVAVASNWAVLEFFVGVGCADGCVEIASDYRCSVRGTFSHNPI